VIGVDTFRGAASLGTDGDLRSGSGGPAGCGNDLGGYRAPFRGRDGLLTAPGEKESCQKNERDQAE
jgi:hypothetical protein